MMMGKRMPLLAAAAACGVFAIAGVTTSSAQEQPPDPCAQELIVSSTPPGDLPLCAVEVTKTLTSGNPTQVGGNMTFQIVITNVGTAPLTDVALVDAYDPTLIDFVSASIAPSLVDEDPADGGALVWLGLEPDPDGLISGVWDSGESLTLTVTFTALVPDTHENCAFVDAVLFIGEGSTEVGPNDDGCEPYQITPAPTNTPTSGGGGGGRRPTSTPTDAPSSTSTPVSTVAPATVVPQRTPAPVGIAAPDTGTGDGMGQSASGSAVIALMIASVTALAGFALIRRTA